MTVFSRSRLLSQRSSVRVRLVLLVLAGMLPMGMVALASIHGLYVEERHAFEQQLRSTTRAFSQVIDQELSRRETLLKTLALSPSLQRGDLLVFYQYARQVASDDSNVVALIDLSGQQILNTRRPYGSQDLPRSTLDNTTVDAGATMVSDLYFAPIGKAYSFAVRVPVRIEGEIRYYLAMGGYASHLQSILENQNLPSTWFGSVVDRNGVIVARSRNGDTLVGRPVSQPTREALAAQRDGARWATSREGERVFISFFTSERYQWSFVIGVSASEVTGTLTRAMQRFALAALVLMALATALAFWLAWGIAKPVERIALAARQLGKGEDVCARHTGLVETDEALMAMHTASTTIRASTERMQQEVRQAVSEAEQAKQIVFHHQRMETLAGLTGGLAHDVNNLLMVIGSNAALLERKKGEESAVRALNGIKRSVAAGARLTRQLLTFARRQPLAPQLLDLAVHVPEVLQLAQPALGRAIRLKTEIDQEGATVLIDPNELELAILNLALNARDAMPDGGDLTVRVARAQEEPGFVRLAVSDTGTGIPKEHLERIFEPFFSTKPAGKGTGLGLSQVFGTCRDASGRVEVQSELGAGTTVTMVLPVMAVAAHATEQPVGAPDTVLAARVLLVDDNEEVREATQSLLTACGAEVVTAADAAEALRTAHAGGFDVVLTDIRMPGELNGIDLAQRLKSASPRFPVVLYTGYTDQMERASALGLRVLQKPARLEQLVIALRQSIQDANGSDIG